jgi:Cu/Ag efflux pump CusA
LLDRSPLPSFRDGTVLVEWNALPGTSLPEMDRITGRVGTELASLPGVQDVGAHVGRAITSDQVVDADAGQLWVSIDPEADYDATATSIRGVVEGYPGISTVVRTYTDERIGRTVPDPGPPVDVRLYGDSFPSLQQKADQVIDILSGIEGVVNPRTQAQPMEPSLDVRVDLRAADRYGIAPGDVRRTAAAFMSGIGVGSLFEQQKVFDVVVWGTPDARNSLTSLRRLSIDTPAGGTVPLEGVAGVSVEPTPSVIRHQDTSRTVDVVADVQGRSVDDVMQELRDQLRGVSFPLEYHAELVGNFPGRQAVRSQALEVTIAVAIVVFLLLQAAFTSWRLAAILFVVSPLALTGGAIALLASGMDVTLGALCALVAAGACSIRSGMMLCARYRQLERSEGMPVGPALIRRGSRERLLATAGSAVAAAIALLPLALSGGPGLEVARPAALVAIGGALASIPAVCIVLPVLYLRFGSSRSVSPAPEPAEAIDVREVVAPNA